ncbi:MAG: L-threonylcarbamoyladenylate synthase [Candidatus Moraniibacteriota bacterium]
MFGDDIAQLLQRGGVGIIPTDTLYGIVASVWSASTIERVYILRKRDLDKPCIVLIADISELEKFSIDLSLKEKAWMENIWPGKVSVILPCLDEKFSYLTRGTKHLAFRIPDDESLRAFLRETGPLIAPSANPQGENPAETIAEAKQYFGDAVDFYIDGGTLQSPPSTIVKLESDRVTVLRPGAVEIKEEAI